MKVHFAGACSVMDVCQNDVKEVGASRSDGFLVSEVSRRLDSIFTSSKTLMRSMGKVLWGDEQFQPYGHKISTKSTTKKLV